MLPCLRDERIPESEHRDTDEVIHNVELLFELLGRWSDFEH